MARIVVADNDLDALDLALTDLRLEGHEVYGALDAADAEALVGTVSPDVVVLDYRMPPGITGLELAERLVTDHPDLRVVIYSNYQRVELRARAATHRGAVPREGKPACAEGGGAAGVSEQYRVQRRWEGPAAVMVVALLAAVAVILIARDHAGLQAEREARAAAADAVFPVDDAMRDGDDRSRLRDPRRGQARCRRRQRHRRRLRRRRRPCPGLGHPGARGRRRGTGGGRDVRHRGSPPASVAERRAHVTGLQVVPLGLRSTLNDLRPSRGGISLAGPERTIQSTPRPATRRAGRRTP